MEIGGAIMENSMYFSQKLKIKLLNDPTVPCMGKSSKENETRY